MKKVLGYVLIIAGALALVLSYSQVQKALSLSLPSFLTEDVLLYGGVIVLLVGAFLSFKNAPKSHAKMSEVPIYHGKDIVGYRRLRK